MLWTGALPGILERGPVRRCKRATLPGIPKRMPRRHPVEKEKSQYPAKERRNGAQAIADIAHDLPLRTHILHLAKLQRGAPTVAHQTPIRTLLHLWLNSEKSDAGKTKTKRVEEQNDKGVAQFVQHHARCV